MMRYLLYLLTSFLMQIVAWIITPVLPLFAELRYGKLNNGNDSGVGRRLPLWLSWFDTPDNSLLGDSNWAATHSGSYWAAVAWLDRNSLYGFKWSVLAAPIDAASIVKSGPLVDWGSPGLQTIKMNSYWQWHLVTSFGPFAVNWNFGWLLNDTEKPKALFMFSPRIRLKGR